MYFHNFYYEKCTCSILAFEYVYLSTIPYSIGSNFVLVGGGGEQISQGRLLGDYFPLILVTLSYFIFHIVVPIPDSSLCVTKDLAFLIH